MECCTQTEGAAFPSPFRRGAAAEGDSLTLHLSLTHLTGLWWQENEGRSHPEFLGEKEKYNIELCRKYLEIFVASVRNQVGKQIA